MGYSDLREQYSVTMVPKLVIIKPNGELVTDRGRKEVDDRGVSAYRSWSTAVFGVQPNRAAAILQSIESGVTTAGSSVVGSAANTPARGNSAVVKEDDGAVDKDTDKDTEELYETASNIVEQTW